MIGIMATIIISELVSSANFIMWCVYMKRFVRLRGTPYVLHHLGDELLNQGLPLSAYFSNGNCGWLIAALKRGTRITVM